jgi:Tubulin like
MPYSVYHSASGAQSPHCLHVVGIGRTGAGMVDAMLRTGEIEDMLDDPRARFTALIVDIGEQDMLQAKDYAEGLMERLKERSIPTERAQIRFISLAVPSRDELFGSLRRYREFLKLEFPRYYWNPNYEPWLPPDVEIPQAGGHFPRALSKAIYGMNYYDGSRSLDKELEDFATSVDQTRLPSMVMVCFAMGGGTGSGMVVDLARHLSSVKLGRRIPVIGVGVLPCSGDPEIYRGGNLFPTFNELDCMLDDEKNQGVVQVWGDLYRNPFTGGFFAVSMEHSWQRLTRYTDTGVPAVRDRMRLQVTNKFVADAFMRFAQHDSGRTLFKALRPSGQTSAPHECISTKSRSWTLFNIAKLTHPAVQVLPGEPISKWHQVMSQWVDYIPQWSGLKEGFETDYAECYIHSPRDMWNDGLDITFKKTMAAYLGAPEDSTLLVSHDEFFDRLTSYIDIILPGVAKTDFTAFFRSRELYDQIDWNQKLLDHSWLLDLGVMMSEPAIRFEGMAGECLWGCACWVVIPYDQLRGDALIPATRKEILRQGIAAMTRTVVATP